METCDPSRLDKYHGPGPTDAQHNDIFGLGFNLSTDGRSLPVHVREVLAPRVIVIESVRTPEPRVQGQGICPVCDFASRPATKEQTAFRLQPVTSFPTRSDEKGNTKKENK